MTDTTLLRSKMDESGYKLRYLAKRTGMSYQCFLNRIKGGGEFTASEILSLSDALGLTQDEREQIFFARDVGK